MNNAEYIDYCEDTYSYISDASKDATGCRFRFDWTEYSLVQLMMQADYWSMRVIEEIEEQKVRDVASIAEFEATVASTIEFGAGDRETAIRWIKDAWVLDNDGYFDSGYFNFQHELPYSYDIDKGENTTQFYNI